MRESRKISCQSLGQKSVESSRSLRQSQNSSPRSCNRDHPFTRPEKEKKKGCYDKLSLLRALVVFDAIREIPRNQHAIASTKTYPEGRHAIALFSLGMIIRFLSPRTTFNHSFTLCLIFQHSFWFELTIVGE